MTIALLSELLLKNDDIFSWLSLTNNEIGVPIPELTDALLKNHTLRKVSCHAGFLGNLSEEDLDLLMSTLSQLSHLQDLWLALPPKQADQSSTVLKTILSSPKCRLQKLTFRGVDDAGCQVLAEALRQPTSCMTELQIRGTTASISSSGVAFEVSRAGILQVADMIKVNQSLQRLDICYKGFDNACFQAMADAIKVNKKLQKLELKNPSSSTGTNRNVNATTSNNNNNNSPGSSFSSGYQALVNSLRSNFTLHYLQTPADGQDKYMMELLTKLNRSGVRSLMCNTTDYVGLADVVEAVVQENTKDISALFEILSLHPSMWDPAKASVEGLSRVSGMPAKKRSMEKSTANSLPPIQPPPKKKLQSTFVVVNSKAQLENSVSPDPATLDLPSGRPRRAKPVMARWNEDLISRMEREKIKNFKRWTPTVIENPRIRTTEVNVPIPAPVDAEDRLPTTGISTTMEKEERDVPCKAAAASKDGPTKPMPICGSCSIVSKAVEDLSKGSMEQIQKGAVGKETKQSPELSQVFDPYLSASEQATSFLPTRISKPNNQFLNREIENASDLSNLLDGVDALSECHHQEIKYAEATRNTIHLRTNIATEETAPPASAVATVQLIADSSLESPPNIRQVLLQEVFLEDAAGVTDTRDPYHA